MAAYFVIDLHVPDAEALARYEHSANPLLKKHEAKVLTRADSSSYDVIEGDWRPSRLVIIEYPSLAAIHDFHSDPEFQPAKHARQSSPGSIARGIAVEGEPSDPDGSGFFVIDIAVHDPEAMKQFEAANTMVEKYGGRFLVNSGDYDLLEGDWRPKRLLIEQFASRRTIHDMYDDPDNAPLKAMRQKASTANALAVDRYRP